jgi:hypothetical protein
MFENFRAESGDYAFNEGAFNEGAFGDGAFDERAFDEGAFDDGQKEGSERDVYAFKEAADTRKRYFLGMTPVQRFVIAVMILLMTCILSSFLLLVSERIAPPFLS